MTGDDLVAVGRVGRPRGVRGESFVEPWTDDPEGRFAVGSVLITEPTAAGPLTVASSSLVGAKLVVRFEGVESREQVEALRGVRLLIAAADRAPLDDPDDFYDTDLIGLQARAVDGADLGVVEDVLHAGGADYLVLRIAAPEHPTPEHPTREHLVPFVKAIVPEVDLASRTVVIDAPDGLFDV